MLKALACRLSSRLASHSSEHSKLRALSTVLMLPQVPCMASIGRQKMLDMFGHHSVAPFAGGTTNQGRHHGGLTRLASSQSRNPDLRL